MTPHELQQTKLGIGTRLRVARKVRGLSQAELGKLVGIDQSVVRSIENGKTLYPRMIDGLAIALKINPAWLYWGEQFAPSGLARGRQVSDFKWYRWHSGFPAEFFVPE